VAGALMERAHRQGGGTQQSVILAAHLASDEVDDAIIEKVHEWHLGHEAEIDADGCTVAAGLVGGPQGRLWAASHVAALSLKRRRKKLAKVLAEIDRKLGQQLWTMAEQATRAAVDKAQVKIKVRTISKRHDKELAAQLASLTSWKPAQMAAAGVTEQELISNAYAVLEGMVPNVIISAELAKVQAVADAYDVDPEDLIDEGDDDEIKERASSSAKYLALSLGALLLAKVTGQELESKGEKSATMSVPFGVIRGAMRVADGSVTAAPVFAAGPGPAGSDGQILEDNGRSMVDDLIVEVDGDSPLAQDGTTLVETWTWVHGFYGEPTREFDAHVDLDNFTTDNRFSDPELAVRPEDDWLDVDFYFPGDHLGCSCEWVSDLS
jgi:hypothetical protein